MELGSVFLLQTLKSSDHTPQTASDGLLTSPNIMYFEKVGKYLLLYKFQPNILVHHWEVMNQPILMKMVSSSTKRSKHNMKHLSTPSARLAKTLGQGLMARSTSSSKCP